MRELTSVELELISGGLGGSEEYDNEDIVVTGSPYPPPYYPPYFPPPYDPPTYYPPPYYPPPTGGDEFPPDWQGLTNVGESNVPFQGQPHMEPSTNRGLTQAERIELAGFTNMSEAQLDAVRIYSSSLVGVGAAATTFSATRLNFSHDYALTDFSNNPDTMDLLIHELYHSQQYNSGFGYSRMIGDTIQVQTSSHDYYTYSQADIQSSIANSNHFLALNIETQAAIAQDLYRISQGLPAQGAAGFTPSRDDLAAAIRLP